VSRSERLTPERDYRLLGARWYAQGLYVKDTKLGAQIAARELYAVKEGDFVYNRLFAWKGSFAVASAEHHGCYVSNEFPCFRVNRDKAEPDYLWYYFSRASAWDEALGLSTGGTPTSRNRLKEGNLLAMKVPLPPIGEQRRVVAKIGDLASKIREAQVLCEETVKEAEAFAVSAHCRLAGNRTRKLGDVLTLDEDQIKIAPTGNYPQVGVRGFGGGLFAKSATLGTETSYKVFNRLYDGAIVLSQVKGWEGAIAVCDSALDGWFVSPEYRTFRCIPGEARPGYFATLVRTEWFWSRLKEATRGVGARRERTRPEQFLGIKLTMPDVEQQTVGERLFSGLDELKRAQSETVSELSVLMPSILEKAFNGEL
jgi:type I restriction enzyme S subunit